MSWKDGLAARVKLVFAHLGLSLVSSCPLCFLLREQVYNVLMEVSHLWRKPNILHDEQPYLPGLATTHTLFGLYHMR